MDIDVKLGKIESKIKEPSFLENKGLSNAVGYYIFDYEPKYELKVREEVSRIKNKINNSDYSFFIQEFDLYEIIIEILKEKDYLEKVFNFEEKKGIEFTTKAINNLLKLNSDNNVIVNYILDRTPTRGCVVFLTGVGKAYPILRSHNVLNNLHQKLDEVPVVLFFPGKYSGRELVLFNTIEGSNYYRAFPLIR